MLFNRAIVEVITAFRDGGSSQRARTRVRARDKASVWYGVSVRDDSVLCYPIDL